MPRATGLRQTIWPLLATVASVAAYAEHPWVLDQLGERAVSRDAADTLRILLGGASYFSAAWLAGRLIGLALERIGTRQRRIPKLLQELISVGLFLAATIATIMLVLGQSMSGALASSGLIVAVVGFTLRNVIGDVFAGIALGLEAPYRIGDWVEVEGIVKGRVIEIGWRTTRLVTRDQTYMILPNSQLARQRIINYSAPRPHYRAKVELTLDHAIPVAEAKRLLTDAARGSELIRRDPAPDCRVVSYDAAGITYSVRYWVPSFAEEVDCRDSILERIDAAMRARDLPAPHSRIRAAVINS